MLGDIFSSVLGFLGVSDTNDANREIAQNNNAFNAAQAREAREFNSIEAQYNRDWMDNQARTARDYNTEMSNTSWQRGVQDMQAAGINPMLAFMKGGASTPQAPMPGGGAASGPAATSSGNPVMLNRIQGALGSAQGFANLLIQAAQADNIAADTKLKDAQAQERNSAVGVNRSQEGLNIENTRVAKSRIAEIEANVQYLDSAKERARADAALSKARTWLTQAEEERSKAETEKTKNYSTGAMFQADKAIREAQSILLKAGVPFAQQQESFSNSNTGHIINFLRLLTGGNAAQNIETIMKVTRP